jgi:hypothetical protein
VYGPLDYGRSRLALSDTVGLAHRVAARRGVLLHLAGHPASIAARLRARDGPAAPAAGRIRAIIDA